MMKPTNWLLAALEREARARFQPNLRPTPLRKGEVLMRPGEAVERVYFPVTALISLISAMPAGDTVQTAMIGRDGALGVFEACGTRRSAFLCEVAVAGEASSMSAEDYRGMYGASEALRVAVHKYVEILLTEARQFVACNALHSVEARLARSVLEALERSQDGRTLPATQETLAQMLGVQRTTVTAALAQLQASGAIRTSRGLLQVQSTAALEQAACCCRETLKMAREEIYASDARVCDD
jgi:CRP-like cAMP-binding protein